MFVRILLSFLATPLFSAIALADAPGTDAAIAICESMNFDSDKQNCLRTCRNKFFDTRAVKICAPLSFGSDKIECLAAIAGREFSSEREINICAGKSFSSDKLACLREAGGVERPTGVVIAGSIGAAPVTPTKEVRDSVAEALQLLENNRPVTASKVLQKLLEKLPK